MIDFGLSKLINKNSFNSWYNDHWVGTLQYWGAEFIHIEYDRMLGNWNMTENEIKRFAENGDRIGLVKVIIEWIRLYCKYNLKRIKLCQMANMY